MLIYFRLQRATGVDLTGNQPPLRDNVSHGKGTGLVSGLIPVDCTRTIYSLIEVTWTRHWLGVGVDHSRVHENHR